MLSVIQVFKGSSFYSTHKAFVWTETQFQSVSRVNDEHGTLALSPRVFDIQIDCLILAIFQ